ncbi:hypothetical protein CLE01_09360 [Cryobacterium levicorallinum]|nr:hypothetical protein CLE01_09360 [Cryobacterium levicorallinum]
MVTVALAAELPETVMRSFGTYAAAFAAAAAAAGTAKSAGAEQNAEWHEPLPLNQKLTYPHITTAGLPELTGQRL